MHRCRKKRKVLSDRTFVRHDTRFSLLDMFINSSDTTCINELRMDRRAFHLLCKLLRRDGGLTNDGSVPVEEQVCIFLHILAHHVKNRTMQDRFQRSGETISRYFNLVLKGVCRLQGQLLKEPEPIRDDESDARWRPFKVRVGIIIIFTTY